jgi:hypothetical protein
MISKISKKQGKYRHKDYIFQEQSTCEVRKYRHKDYIFQRQKLYKRDWAYLDNLVIKFIIK